MTRENVARFFREVADASPIPIMIYNFPTVTAGQDLDSDILEDLAKHSNIVGTKLSCGNIGKLHRLTSTYSSTEFAVYAGKSESFLHGLYSGSAGTIAALPNIVPKVHKKLWNLWKEGKTAEAFELQGILGKADWAVSKVGGISGVKAIVAYHFGYGQPVVRGPLKTLEWQNLQKDKHIEVIETVVAMEKAL